MKIDLGIRWAKTDSSKERFALVLLAMVSMAEAIVTILSLGFVTAEWRANLVFSEWFDQFCHPDRRT